MDKKQEIQMLGQEKISKLLLKFSIPCVTGLLIGALYNIVDQIFIGNSELGYLGNAATGVSFPVICIANAFAYASVRQLRILAAGANAQVGCCTVADTPGKGIGNANDREGNARGCIAQIAQFAVADEDLVNDIVQRADQQTHYTGNGKAQQQAGRFFLAQIAVGSSLRHDETPI